MTDETQGTAETPAEGETVSTTELPEDQGTAQEEVSTEGEKPEGEEAGTEDAGEKPEGEQPRKKLSGAQKAKRRETFLLNQLAERERELEDIRQASRKTEGKAEDEKPPREEDFNGDFFAFQTAQTAYAAKQAVRDEMRRREESERGTRDAERRSQLERERQMAHLERIDEAREAITDFDQVMGKMKGVNVRQEVIEEIISSDKSALISYHLANNPSKLDELNAMSGRELAREMGRLEASLKLPAPKKQTSAPPPVSAVKGGTAPASPETDLNAWLDKTYGKSA